MRKRIAPATPPVGSYRNIPYFALRGVFRQRGYRDQDPVLCGQGYVGDEAAHAFPEDGRPCRMEQQRD